MDDHAALLALKERLPRTWPAFFERHGTFTPAQARAIPLLLDGANLLLCAPTASGKTAAALAPLIERHCPPLRPPGQLRILYLAPTRALANDLRARLAHPLGTLGLRLGVKTRDSAFDRARPPDVLITTPESTDSLLAADARLFAQLRAVVLDELHLFDGTPRGDQLRVLLGRIRRVRAYAAERADAPDAELQYAALSATIAEPEAAAGRYFSPAQVVQAPGGRPLAAELIACAPEGAAELLAYLATFRARGWRKALAFCNSRAEVEAYAAAVRAASPFGSAVFTHYSNLDSQRRREIEQQFAAAEAAICFTSSTLELGIDIGTVDQVILIGPPGSAASFVQRIGRGNRRGNVARAACCHRTPLERLLFEALLSESDAAQGAAESARSVEAAIEDREAGDHEGADHHLVTLSPCHVFRPSIAVQQIFSLIKQSPTAAVRPAELGELFAGMLAPEDLRTILGYLTVRGYLAAGRPGEWRAGPRLNRLYDEQTSARVALSIYSNIDMGEPRTYEIRDQHTGRAVARVDSAWLSREGLTLEGRPVSIEWCDGEAVWVTTAQDREAPGRAIYRSGRQLLGYELARRLPERLGLAPGQAPFIAAPEGWWWFHWLGDLYGQAALDLLRYRVPAAATEELGLALWLPDPPRAPPDWSEQQVTRYLHDSYRSYEPLLALGAFQHLLPAALRRRAVVEQFDVPRFLAAVAGLIPVAAPEDLALPLGDLLKSSAIDY
jgi:ATP-dependent Lhr-like helicase